MGATVDGRNPLRTTWKSWETKTFVGIYVGESSFHGFLGGQSMGAMAK